MDVDKQFYMLTREMVLRLATDLSNLWMIADDADQYICHLLQTRWTGRVAEIMCLCGVPSTGNKSPLCVITNKMA